MKVATGLKWGLAVGAVVGVLQGIVSYLVYLEIGEAVLRFIYQEMISHGTPPDVAARALEISRTFMGVGAVISSIVVNIIIYLIIGVIMAAVWEKLRTSWLVKGVIFSVALLAINIIPTLASPPPPPGFPQTPVQYTVLHYAITLAGPLLLAAFLNKATQKEASS